MKFLKKLFGRKATQSDNLEDSKSTDLLPAESEFNSEFKSEFNDEVTSVFNDLDAEGASSAEPAIVEPSPALVEPNPLGDPTDDADLPDVTMIFDQTAVANLDVPVDDFADLGSTVPDENPSTPPPPPPQQFAVHSEPPELPELSAPFLDVPPPIVPENSIATQSLDHSPDDDHDLKTIVGGIPISLDMPDPVLLIPDPAMPEPVIADTPINEIRFSIESIETPPIEEPPPFVAPAPIPIPDLAVVAPAAQIIETPSIAEPMSARLQAESEIPVAQTTPGAEKKVRGKLFGRKSKENVEDGESWLRSLGLLDKSLLAGSTLTFVISVFLLFEDGSLLSKSDIENLTPVGTFAKSAKDVRRKVNNGLTWHDVSVKDQVFEGDSIFTGDGSEASINLNSGGSLTIDAKSLVVVKTSDGQLQLDLHYGSLLGKIDTAQPVILINDGVRQELISTNAELRITKEAETGNAQIQVLSGEVRLRDLEKGESKVIRTNEATTISSEAVGSQKSLPVTLLEPESGHPIWKNETASLHFAWKADDAATGFNLEFAKDPGFKKVLFSKRTTTQQFDLEKIPEIKGQIYWRVSAESSNSEETTSSRPRRFMVYEDIAPQPIFPKDRQVFTLGQNGQNEQQRAIDMSWKDQAGSKKFKVQISADNQFRSLVFEQEVEKPSLTSKPLDPGEYWWRVVGLHPERLGEMYSAPLEFSINAQEGPLLPPQLENPRITYEIPKRTLEQENADTGADLVPLRWSKGAGAIGYALEVARNEKFEKSKSINLALVNEFRIKSVKPGVFYWRVTTLGKANRRSEPSAAGRLVVTLPAPEINVAKTTVHDLTNPENAKKGHAEVDPSWKTLKYAKGYELDWSRDSKFENRKTFKTRELDRKIAVAHTGTYYYRVRAIDSTGTPLSPYSNVSKLDVIKTPPVVVAERKPSNDLPVKKPTPSPTPLPIAGLVPPKPMKSGAPELGISNVPAPKLREPRTDTSVVGIGNSPVFVGMKWHPVKGAKTYRLEVSASPDFSSTVASTTTQGTNYFLEKTLPSGTLYWRVRAIFKTEQTAWSGPNTFTVSYKAYRAKSK